MNRYENAIMRATPYILILIVPFAFLTGTWYEANFGQTQACSVLFTLGDDKTDVRSFNATDWDGYIGALCAQRAKNAGISYRDS